LQKSEKQGYRMNIFKGMGWICKQNNVGLSTKPMDENNDK